MKNLLYVLLLVLLLTGCCSDQILTNTVIYDKPELSLEELPSMNLKEYPNDSKMSQQTLEVLLYNTSEMDTYIQTQSKIITLYKEYYESKDEKIEDK